MKRLQTTLAVTAVAFAVPAWGLQPSEVFEKVTPSVWVVRALDASERPFGQGSAVVIGPGKLVTNCHVLAKAVSVQVRREGVTYDAKLEHADVARDLCLLKVAKFDAAVVQIANIGALRVGQRVYAVGSPQGMEATLSEGLISGLRTVYENPHIKVSSEVIQTTAPISPGSSGGGLFDEEGRLVGITTLMLREAQNINIAFPADWIAEVPERSQAALAQRKKRAAGASAAAVNAAPGLPAAGTTWSYSFVERIFSRIPVVVTVRVLQVSDAVVEEAVTANAQGAKDARRVINARESHFQEFPLSSSSALIELAPYLVAINGGNAPDDTPAPGGYPLGGPSLPGWSVFTRVAGWDRITVPAGTFRALRVEVTGQRSTPIGGRTTWAGRFEMSVWYAPDVNRIVRQEHRVWTADGISPMLSAHEVLELIAYRPPS